MDDDLCGGSGEEIDEEMIESVRLHCKEALQSAEQFLLDADAASEITYETETWLPCFQERIELEWAWLAITAENSVLGIDVGSEGHSKEQQAAKDLETSLKKCKHLCRRFVLRDYAAVKHTEGKAASSKVKSKVCETPGRSNHVGGKEGKHNNKSKQKLLKLIGGSQMGV